MVQNIITAQPVGTGATIAGAVDTRRLGTITVAFTLLGTTTPADLTVNDPTPYDATGAQLSVTLPPVSSVAAVSDGANVVALRTYNVGGIEKLRFSAKNNNAGTLNLSATIFGQYAGQA